MVYKQYILPTIIVLGVAAMLIANKLNKKNVPPKRDDDEDDSNPSTQKDPYLVPPPKRTINKIDDEGSYKLILKTLTDLLPADKKIQIYAMNQYDFIDLIKKYSDDLGIELAMQNASIRGEQLRYQKTNIASRLHTLVLNYLMMVCKPGTGERTTVELAGHAHKEPVGFNTTKDCIKLINRSAVYATLKNSTYHKPVKNKKVGRWHIQIEYWTKDRLQLLLNNAKTSTTTNHATGLVYG